MTAGPHQPTKSEHIAAIIRGSRGHLVVYSAGNDAVLVMSGPLSANLTLMRIEARAAAVQINSLFGRH